MGVTLEKGKYRARAYHKGKAHSLGYFDTKIAAQAAVAKFKIDKVEQIPYEPKLNYEKTGHILPLRRQRNGVFQRLLDTIYRWKR